MTDIVERLKSTPLYEGCGDASTLGEEAADEIKRLTRERDEALERAGGIRVCLNCGKTAPAGHPRGEPLPECVGPEGLSACTFDMTPVEACQHWREKYHKVRAERDEALERAGAETTIQNAFDRAAEPLRTLESYLAVFLDPGYWPDAERMLSAIAAALAKKETDR